MGVERDSVEEEEEDGGKLDGPHSQNP